MTMTPKSKPLPIGLRRLMKLAEHLESGTLGHEVFDFESINDGDSFDASGCGTHGCAMGELPFVFPDRWKFTPDGELTARRSRDRKEHTDDEVSAFFGISHEESVFLFYPGTREMGRSGLPGNANAKTVAAHIRRFVEGKVAK